MEESKLKHKLAKEILYQQRKYVIKSSFKKIKPTPQNKQNPKQTKPNPKSDFQNCPVLPLVHAGVGAGFPNISGRESEDFH